MVWNSNSGRHNLVVAIYRHLNCKPTEDGWHGWNILWRIFTTPRVKHFLWLLFHGRLSTFDFLYPMNMGHDKPCILCGLSQETTDYLFCYCPKVSNILSQLSSRLGQTITFSWGFQAGGWITDDSYNLYTISVIAAIAWFFWKSRCDAIFCNTNPNSL